MELRRLIKNKVTAQIHEGLFCSLFFLFSQEIPVLNYNNEYICFQEEASLLDFFTLGEGELWIDFTAALEAKDELTSLYQLATSFLI